MKKFLVVCVLWLITVAAWGQSPMAGSDQAAIFREQKGTAYVEGSGILTYFLYDTYSKAGGDGDPVFYAIFDYVERLGWTIEFDSAEIYNPNHALADSVKAMMLAKDCDMSFTLITYPFDQRYGNIEFGDVIINNYDKSTGIWSTYIIFIVRQRVK